MAALRKIAAAHPAPAGIPLSVKKTLLRRRRRLGKRAFRAPNQGLDSSFCRWIAGQRLATNTCFFAQTPVGMPKPDSELHGVRPIRAAGAGRFGSSTRADSYFERVSFPPGRRGSPWISRPGDAYLYSMLHMYMCVHMYVNSYRVKLASWLWATGGGRSQTGLRCDVPSSVR